MQITLEALEQALAPIQEIGQGETTFDISGTAITLRILLPEEEAEVQKYAGQVLNPNGEDNRSNAAEFLERIKIGTLSHCITAIGAQDLHDVEFIETAEKLANGNAVKITRVAALRKLLLKWSNPIRLALFRKYAELVASVERQAESAIKFDPVDIDAEIERLESRVSQLKALKEANAAGLASEMSKMVQSVVSDEEAAVEGAPEEAVQVPQQAPQQAHQPQEEPQAAAVQPRRPISPVATTTLTPATPPRRDPNAPKGRPADMYGSIEPEVREPNARQPAPVADQGHYVAGMDVPDSFLDPNDSMDDAIEAENRRLMQHRMRGQGQGQQPPSLMTSVRRAPHLDAIAVEELERDSTEYVGRTHDGVDAYRMTSPEEIVVPRSQPAAPNVVPPGINPRFNPTRRNT